MKCDKIANKKIETNNVTGNYLFADNKYYYFNKFARNSVFLKDKTFEQSNEKVVCYYNYLTDAVNIYKNSQNKPSILYFGNKYETEALTETETKNLNVNEESLYAKVTDLENFDEFMNNLIESRSNSQYSNFKPVYVFLDNFSKISEENLARFITVSKSRYIYFVLLIEDEKQFDEFVYNVIVDNCSLTFCYNENGIKDIVNAYGDILDKNKKAFVKNT